MAKTSFERAVTRAKFDNPLLASRAAGALRLEVEVVRLAGEKAETRLVFEDGFRIGSHPSNDLVLADATVSRFHCAVSLEDGVFRLVDVGSRNGTHVGGARVLSVAIERETTVLLGDSLVVLRPASVAESADEGAALGRSAASGTVVRGFGDLVGASPAMQGFFDVLARVAASDIDVLVFGESGTGKELVASELAQRSRRAKGPFVVVDCGAISPSLVESELFGHVRGAFTGADREREGALELADGGTVFLDEIGELPLELQPKLLRALEAREVRRVGASKMKRIDVRVVAATHRDLEREVAEGRFREDLYFRLAKVTVRVPPLRDRVEDIPLLVRKFLASTFGDGADAVQARLFTGEAMELLRAHAWPGNVRELRNVVERSAVLGHVNVSSPRPASGKMPAAGRVTREVEVPGSTTEVPVDRSMPFRQAKERAIEAFERAYLGPVLEEHGGNVSAAARAARMDRMYLRELALKHGLKKPEE